VSGRAAGALLLSLGGLAFLAAQVHDYVLRRNAYEFCARLPVPPEALSHEGAVAGYEVVQLPIGGIDCWWNTSSTSIITTFHPDLMLTGLVLGSVALAVAGVALLIVGLAPRRRPTGEGGG
jgi:hypothetical protein